MTPEDFEAFRRQTLQLEELLVLGGGATPWDDIRQLEFVTHG